MARLSKEDVVQRLRRRARRWGGDLIEVSDKEFESRRVPQAPFTGWHVGLRFRAKQVVFAEFAQPRDIAFFTATLLHEMGHVFATTRAPYKAEEYDFLGWEIALARKVGLTDAAFCRANADYEIDEHQGDAYYGQFRDFVGDPKGRLAFLTQRVERAKELGLIRRGHPVSVRKS